MCLIVEGFSDKFSLMELEYTSEGLQKMKEFGFDVPWNLAVFFQGSYSLKLTACT